LFLNYLVLLLFLGGKIERWQKEFNNLSREESFLNNSIDQFSIPVANTNDSFYFLRFLLYPVVIGRLFCCSSRYCPRARFCVKNWSKPNSKYRMYSYSRKKTSMHAWRNILRIDFGLCRLSQGDLSRLARCCIHVIRKHSIVHCCIERTVLAYHDCSRYSFLRQTVDFWSRDIALFFWKIIDESLTFKDSWQR